jgi:hypothetical protein
MRYEIPETPLVSGIPLRSIPETTQKLDHRVIRNLSQSRKARKAFQKNILATQRVKGNFLAFLAALREKTLFLRISIQEKLRTFRKSATAL